APLPVGVVNRLVVPGKWPVVDEDALKPFDRSHCVPAGHDRAQWKTVLWRQVGAIHSVDQQHIATRFLQRNTARELQFAVRTLGVFKHATVGSFENYFGRIWLSDRSIKQSREWDASPLRITDCTKVPLHPFHFRLEKISVVPCTLQSHRSC